MQQENSQKVQIKSHAKQNQQNELLNLIKQTYQGQSTEIVKRAQQKLLNQLHNNLKVLMQVFKYLTPPYSIDRNNRTACGNLLKQVYYKISENKQIDKEPYITAAYDILLATNYGDHQIKQMISVSLQYIFNRDEEAIYKTKWKEHAKMQILGLNEQPEAWTVQTAEVIYGLTLFSISYFNSLVQPEDQAAFLVQMQDALCKSAIISSQFIKNNNSSNQQIPKVLFLPGQKIFQFFQLATQRILEQQELVQQQAQNLKYNQNLTNIMLQYLFLMCEQQTIVSKFAELNKIKVSILQILYLMNLHQFSINITILQLLLTTFIKQSTRFYNYDNDDDQYELIVSKVINVIQTQLAHKKHYDFFLNNKISILFSLLMYCQTGPKQQSYIIQQPQKFAQLADQFSQSFNTSPIIKVRASKFIRTFVENIDEGLSNLTELCIIFITGSLKASSQDSQLLKAAKETYSNFQFMNLQAKHKLDISFMILTTVSDQMQKRVDLKTVIASVLITNFNVLMQITNELVLLRLIRLIGYYPTSLYFSFIQKCMAVSKVFLLEGLNCFNRILKNKQYLQTFSIIHLVYSNLMEFIEVTDSIFERLILQNYHNIVSKNQQLYQKICNKIYDSFSLSIQDLENSGAKQRAIICLNYLQKMLKMQNKKQCVNYLQSLFVEMQVKGINCELLQDNFIGIYNILISKSIMVSEKVEEFIKKFSSPTHLHQLSNYTDYFKLLNKLIVKTDKIEVLEHIYHNMVNYIGEIEKDKFNFAILPLLAHSIGHILVVNLSIPINNNFINYLVYLTLKKQSSDIYQALNKNWYVFLILHYIYRSAATIRQLLLSTNKYYAFMITLFSLKLKTNQERKAAVLAAQQLLSYETDQKSQKEIIKYCVSILNEQKNKYLVKPQRRKNRRNENKQQEEEAQSAKPQENQEEQRMQNEDLNENNNLFEALKHPFLNIDQFVMFKIRLAGLVNATYMHSQQIQGLHQILQYQWHKTTIRRVFRITS